MNLATENAKTAKIKKTIQVKYCSRKEDFLRPNYILCSVRSFAANFLISSLRIPIFVGTDFPILKYLWFLVLFQKLG